MANIQSITDAQLEAEVLLSPIPVLVDFYADWCGPCKTLAPRLEELAQKYDGVLKIVKVDVDANPMAVQMFRIQSMPTLVLVKDQQIVDVAQGALDRTQLEAFVAAVATPTGGGVESWDPQRLKLGAEAMVATPIDVRPAADFERARIPGAVNIPTTEMPGRLQELADLGTDVVLYDRTDAGVKELAASVAETGLPVGVLDGGFLGWEAELLPVEKG